MNKRTQAAEAYVLSMRTGEIPAVRTPPMPPMTRQMIAIASLPVQLSETTSALNCCNNPLCKTATPCQLAPPIIPQGERACMAHARVRPARPANLWIDATLTYVYNTGRPIA